MCTSPGVSCHIWKRKGNINNMYEGFHTKDQKHNILLKGNLNPLIHKTTTIIIHAWFFFFSRKKTFPAPCTMIIIPYVLYSSLFCLLGEVKHEESIRVFFCEKKTKIGTIIPREKRHKFTFSIVLSPWHCDTLSVLHNPK